MDRLEIHLDHVDVDLGTSRILHDLTLTIAGQDHYAVVGDNGAGKTTLLRLLSGELWPSQRGGGERVYRLNGDESRSPIGVRDHIRLVTPAMADWYLRHDQRVPIWEVICAGLTNTPFLYRDPTDEERDQARSLGADMGLAAVLDRPLRQVSTGQAKRALLARAFIARPLLMAVDELTQGLDRQGQRRLLDALNRIAASGRTRLLVSGHGLLPIPEAVTGRIYIEHGRLVDRPTAVAPEVLDLPREQEGDVRQDIVFRAGNCSVVMDGVAAVDRLDWTVRTGESWGVLGHNGGGKSTLLQLASAYRRCWPGGEVRWFGQDGSGGLAPIRRRMGILAPWLGERMEPGATCRDVILSGLCDGLGVHRGLGEDQIAGAEALARDWGMGDWLDRGMHTLSYGQTRQVMLARAVIHGPELLVLDEPFSGLDRSWQGRMAELLAHWTAQGRTMILATHSPEFMGDLLSHGLVLEGGLALALGPWAEVQESEAFGRLFGEERTGT